MTYLPHAEKIDAPISEEKIQVTGNGLITWLTGSGDERRELHDHKNETISMTSQLLSELRNLT